MRCPCRGLKAILDHPQALYPVRDALRYSQLDMVTAEQLIRNGTLPIYDGHVLCCDLTECMIQYGLD